MIKNNKYLKLDIKDFDSEESLFDYAIKINYELVSVTAGGKVFYFKRGYFENKKN